jgi:hypothetical protein
MSAFSKADVQNVRVGTELNVCLWPKAAVQVADTNGVKRKDCWTSLNGRFSILDLRVND